MPVQTEHRFPLDLSVLDAAGSRVTLADLARPGAGGGRVLHAHRHLPGLHPARPRPGPAGPTHPRRAAGGGTRIADARRRVRRILGDRVTVVPSDGAQAHLAAGLHRTLLLQHSGTMLVDSAGVVRYRLATALPTGSFDGPTLQAAIDRL
jgi:hypothetical protein